MGEIHSYRIVWRESGKRKKVQTAIEHAMTSSDALHQWKIKNPKRQFQIMELRPLPDVTEQQAEAIYSGDPLEKIPTKFLCSFCKHVSLIELKEDAKRINELIGRVGELTDKNAQLERESREMRTQYRGLQDRIAENVKSLARAAGVLLAEDED